MPSEPVRARGSIDGQNSASMAAGAIEELPAVEERAAPGLAAGQDVLGHGQVAGQAQLLVDHGDPGPQGVGGRARREGPAVERHRAGVGLEDAGRDAHERALAGAVLADDRVDLPGPEIEIHAVEDPDLAEALADGPHLEEGCRHAAPFAFTLRAGMNRRSTYR